MFVKPGSYKHEDGSTQRLKVRDPQTLRLMPDEGFEVSDIDFHYARLLRDGDVVLMTDTEIRALKAATIAAENPTAQAEPKPAKAATA
jgi:hypothetical protein